jgi:protein-tyrosine phosphatase
MVGVSRSVTIVIAYLLKKYKYSLGQVISMIQRKRKKVNG